MTRPSRQIGVKQATGSCNDVILIMLTVYKVKSGHCSYMMYGGYESRLIWEGFCRGGRRRYPSNTWLNQMLYCHRLVGWRARKESNMGQYVMCETPCDTFQALCYYYCCVLTDPTCLLYWFEGHRFGRPVSALRPPIPSAKLLVFFQTATKEKLNCNQMRER